MRRALAAVLIIGAAFVGTRAWERGTPERRYREFAEEILHGRFDKAAALSDGLPESELARKAGLDPAMLQTLFPSRFEVRTRERADDGALTLTAVQTVLFNPPGVESALRPAMFAKMNQTVTLRKGSGGWKVVAFENKLDKMDSLSAR